VIGKFLENNYKEVLICAKRIVRRMNYNAEELISETYLEVHEKNPYLTTDRDFVKWFTWSMKLSAMSKRSNFNKSQRLCGVELQFDPGNEDWQNIYTEIDASGKSEGTKELMIELSHLTKDKAIQYVEVMEYKDSLAPWDRELFELNIEKGLSGRKIVKIKEMESGTKMSYKTYNNRIKQIKKGLNGNS